MSTTENRVFDFIERIVDVHGQNIDSWRQHIVDRNIIEGKGAMDELSFRLSEHTFLFSHIDEHFQLFFGDGWLLVSHPDHSQR